jgi:hypothetical protein
MKPTYEELKQNAKGCKGFRPFVFSEDELTALLEAWDESKYPLAEESASEIGWTLDYDFLKALSEKAANASGEQIQMEQAEAILIAFRELPAPYTGKEE